MDRIRAITVGETLAERAGDRGPEDRVRGESQDRHPQVDRARRSTGPAVRPRWRPPGDRAIGDRTRTRDAVFRLGDPPRRTGVMAGPPATRGVSAAAPRENSTAAAAGPLHGVTVLEVGIPVTAPHARMHLADRGGLEHLLEDGRHATASTRDAHWESVVNAIGAVTATRRTEELVEVLERPGVACAPIAGFGLVFTDDQPAGRDHSRTAQHPTAGPGRQLGSPVRLSRTPPGRGSAGPLLGSGTRRSPEAAGLPADDTGAPVAAGIAVEARTPGCPEAPADAGTSP